MNKCCDNCKNASGSGEIRFCGIRGGAAYYKHDVCDKHEFNKPKPTSRRKDEEE